MSKLCFKNTSIKYNESTEMILEIDNFCFSNGLNFIIGKNGSGKSTLLKGIISHEDLDIQGDIIYNKETFTNEIIGIVSQNPLNSITGELTFIENIIQANSSYWDLMKLSVLGSREAKQKAIHFIKSFNFDFDIDNLLFKESAKLSAGQQQLLAILMRVYRSGKVLLLDECTANLDDLNTRLIIDTIRKIAQQGVIILFVTHQWELLDIQNSTTYLIEDKKINNYHE